MGDGTVDATRLGIDVDLTVSGPTVRAPRHADLQETRRKSWVEATYVYPLPEGGAVDTLKMVIGDRVVIGRNQGAAAGACDLRAGRGKNGAEGGR